MTSPAAIRGQEVRQRLLVAAAALIPERGWTAVSTRVLAERAGVTPSVVHYHFPSLRALLNEAVMSSMRQLIGEIEGFLSGAETPDDAVDAMLASADQYTGADRASLLFIEAFLAATRDEQLREQIAGAVDDFRHRLGAWMNERDVPMPSETAAVLMAAIDGLLLHRGLGAAPDRHAVATVLRRLVEREEDE